VKIIVPVPFKIEYNDHLHYGFLFGALRLCGHEVIPYGPGARARGGEALAYDAARPMSETLRCLGADAIFSRDIDHPWIGWEDAKKAGVLMVAYECDMHYRKNLQLFAGTDLLLVRAARAERSARGMRGYNKIGAVRWLPFSFDPSLVPPREGSRRESVYFAGARAWWAYPSRSEAIDALLGAGMLSPESAIDKYQPMKQYYAALTKHALGLTCGSIFSLTVAKHLEIAAAGAILLTDGPYGLDRLIPAQWWLRYDPSTVVEQVRQIILDPGLMEGWTEAAAAARAYCYAHHTDARRAMELGEMLNDL